MQRIPLHPSQYQIYLDQTFRPESPAYNIGAITKMTGNLDIDAFRLTVRSLPDVFDSYMYVPYFDDYGIHWESEKQSLPQLQEMDFSDYENPSVEALKWSQSQFNIPFSVASGSKLYHQCLLKISDSEHWYFYKYHHMLVDGVGLTIKNDYISKKYKSIVNKTNISFEYPTFSQDALNAATQFYYGKDRSENLEYWKNRIPTLPDSIFQKIENNEVTDSGRYILTLNASEKSTLLNIQKTTGASLQQLTIAAFAIICAHTYGNKEFIFGFPLHRRNGRQARNTLGMYAAVHPFKCEFDENILLKEFITNIATTCRQDYRYLNYFLSDVRKHLNLDSGKSIIDVLINHEFYDIKIDMGELVTSETITLSSEYEIYALHFRWRESSSTKISQLYADFRFDYFTKTQIESLTKRIVNLLLRFESIFETKLKDIQILSIEEHDTILNDFNKTMVACPKEANILMLFEEQVISHTECVAASYGNTELTYGQLSDKINQLTIFLRNIGIRSGSLIPICINRSLEMIVGIMAIMKSGAAYVPVDPNNPVDRLKYLIEDSGSNIVLTDSLTEKKFATLNVKAISIEKLVLEPTANMQATDFAKPSLSNLAYVMYTSGSTGVPKGVMIDHSNLANHLIWAREYFSLTFKDSILQMTNFCFDISIWELFLPLVAGARIVFAEREKHKDSNYVRDLIREKEITQLVFVPSMLNVFLDNLALNECKSVRSILSIGEALNFQTAILCKEKMPNTSLYNLYGPTETTVAVTCTPIDLMKNELISIGKPISNTKLYILNEYNQLVPIGTKGELYIAGSQVGKGYLHQHEQTKNSFLENKFADHSLPVMYKTGDICSWLPDGDILYHGRLDTQIKLHGFRIELMEIERQISLIDNVREAKVITIKNNPSGATYLSAYIQIRNKVEENYSTGNVKTNDILNDSNTRYHSAIKERILIELKRKLPDYMIPNHIILVTKFPVTANGKLDLNELVNLIEIEEKPVYSLTITDQEKTLLDIWKEALAVENINIHDSFFKLRGDSLIALKIVNRAKKKGIEIQALDIFMHQTIHRILKHTEVVNTGK